jgi:putative transposase
MTIPFRGRTGHGMYFITASTYEKQCLLQSEKMATLLIDVLFHYQRMEKYLLHEFVIMPNHIHLLITPAPNTTIEKTIQFIKGGFSYRVRKELGFVMEIWQTSFYDHRVRDADEYVRFRRYVHMNPVKRGLSTAPDEFPYSSANLRLDDVPQWLKPSARGPT